MDDNQYIDTKAEAKEFFEHNPYDKEPIHIVLLTSLQKQEIEDYYGDLCVLKTEHNPNPGVIFDDLLDYTLSEVKDTLFDKNNVVADIIDGYQKHGGLQSEEVKNKVEREVLKRLNPGEE